MWDKETFNAQALDVENDNTLRPMFGMKGIPALNNLKYFHTIDGLPPDLCHDLFERVVPEIIISVLKHMHNDGILTFHEINERINQFVFATIDKDNKPSPITLDSNGRNPKLNHTQSQMRCFCRLLPLSVGDSMEETDAYWKLYMSLLDVLDYVCAFKFNNGDIEFLNELVEIFTKQRLELFPDAITKPKLHYLLHYGQQIKKFGPLRHYWTIRHESQHMFYKAAFQHTKNRKNICKTFTLKNQRKQAYLHQQTNFYDNLRQISTKNISVYLQLMPNAQREVIEPLIGNAETVNTVKSVTMDGVKYSVGDYVAIGIKMDYWNLHYLLKF